jgi:hypothetical protein
MQKDLAQPVRQCENTVFRNEYSCHLLCSGRVAQLFPQVSSFKLRIGRHLLNKQIIKEMTKGLGVDQDQNLKLALSRVHVYLLSVSFLLSKSTRSFAFLCNFVS